MAINAEVVEHARPAAAWRECASLAKPIDFGDAELHAEKLCCCHMGAEYVMRYLPIGTHDWKKFVKPSELKRWIGNEFTLKYQVGMRLNPLKGEWLTTSSLAVNYIQAYSKHK